MNFSSHSIKSYSIKNCKLKLDSFDCVVMLWSFVRKLFDLIFGNRCLTYMHLSAKIFFKNSNVGTSTTDICLTTAPKEREYATSSAALSRRSTQRTANRKTPGSAIYVFRA